MNALKSRMLGDNVADIIPGYRVRLRFQSANTITDKNAAYVFDLCGQSIKLQDPTEKDIVSTKNVVLNAYGFQSEEQARKFGGDLKISLSVTSAIKRMGVDVGDDKASGGFFKNVKDKIKETHGITLRDNVHGLDISFDDGSVRYSDFSVTASVSTPAELLAKHIQVVFIEVSKLTTGQIEAARILNIADYAMLPSLRLALSFAAIEAIMSKIPWTVTGQKLFDELITIVQKKLDLDEMEKEKIINSIKSSKDFGQSSNSCVRALLDDLSLSELWSDMAKVYGVRSKLFHGKYVAQKELQDAAQKARDFAHVIFIESLKKCGIEIRE